MHYVLVVKEEAEFVDEECVEEECLDSTDGCGVSEAAMLASLYDDHEVKDELVLGPERPHRPIVAPVVRDRALGDADGGCAAGGAGAQLARCSVRLERLASHAARDHQPRGTAGCDAATPPRTDSDIEQETYVRPEKEQICDLCGESFDLKSDLIKHVAVHIHVPTSGDLGAGRPDVTGNAPALVSSAVVSGRRRSCSVRLERLQVGAERRTCRVGRRTYKLHATEPAPTPHVTTTIYQCHHCGKRFRNKSVLKKHIRIHLSLGPSSNSTRQNITSNRQEMSHKDRKPYKCSTCEYMASKIEDLQKHQLIHAGDKPYQCRYCDHRSRQRENLRTHEMIHTGNKPFKCNYCHYKCNRKVLLRIHEINHTGEKPFDCSNCDYKCNSKAKLRRHEIIHTDENPFQCSYCEYKCNQKPNLRRHERTHTGEKPFGCSNCVYKCISIATLRRHQLIHSGEKPFQCSYCEYKCRQIPNLRRHECTHTGEKSFDCSNCDYKCISKATLRRHQLIHSGEKPFQCSYCEFRCRHKGNLKRHLKRKH
ncbi:zinc finger protein 271-like [Cydia splendana]|uniref:zinc finger protein 271-like n=1 Tax=Cydia splendana TaxID=1100963 RepID=UPI00300CAAA5